MFVGQLDPATGVLFPRLLRFFFWDVFYQRGTYLTCMIPYKQAGCHPQALSCVPLCYAEVCVYAQGHQAVNSAALSVIINSLLWVHFSKKKTPSRRRLCCLVHVRLFWQRLWVEIELNDHENVNVDL